MGEEAKRNNDTAYILKTLKDLIELGRKEFYVKEYRAGIDEADILGCIVAKYCNWNREPILKVISSALEDANFHTLNAQIDELVHAKATPIS